MDRRQVLKGISGLAGGSLLGCEMDAEPRDWTDVVDHIVLVYMENRSFDHYLGALRLNEGREDVDGLMPEFNNLGPDMVPLFPTPVSNICLPDPPHGWTASRTQFAGGSNTGFVDAYVNRHSTADGAWVMGYHERRDLPILYALADAHTICDRWFASVLSSTWPNRLYSHAAQSQGATGNYFPDSSFFTARTIWEQLDEASVPWSYYFWDAPFLALFSQLLGRDELRFADAFFDDCAAGTLPSVSMIEPSFIFNDDHPPKHPMFGQLFLASVYAALAQSPLWDRTLLLITYDEHGGFYDHVPPPTVPDTRADQGFDQLGFRVPSLACGPWVRSGAVDHTQYDHTSPLALIQARFGLDALTRRDRHADPMSAIFDHGRIQSYLPRAPTVLPTIDLNEEQILAQCADPTFFDTSQPELMAAMRTIPHRFDQWTQRDRVAKKALTVAQSLGVCSIY